MAVEGEGLRAMQLAVRSGGWRSHHSRKLRRQAWREKVWSGQLALLRSCYQFYQSNFGLAYLHIGERNLSYSLKILGTSIHIGHLVELSFLVFRYSGSF